MVSAPLFAPRALSDAESGPLYLRLQSMIRAGIVEGRLQPNDALPAEREMAVHLGVSRVTVRKALRGLVDEGVLRQRRGSGTFIARGAVRVEQPLSRLTSFTEDMTSKGLVPGTRWLDRSLGPPDADEATRLHLKADDHVSRLSRLRLVDGAPMAIENAVVPAFAIPDPACVEDSLYDALARAGMVPVRAVQRLGARALPAADAALLGLPPGAAAVALERVSYLADGRVIEFTRSLYRGDACDFVAELNLSPIDRSPSSGLTEGG